MIITHVGSYHIGQNISEAKGAKEYDEERYESFAAAGAPRTIQDEQMFDGGDVAFAGIDNWQITIGTIKGVIYKFGLVNMSENIGQATQDYTTSKSYLLDTMQKPSKKSLFSKEIVWQQPDGSVTLNFRSMTLPPKGQKYGGVIVDITSGELMRKFGAI